MVITDAIHQRPRQIPASDGEVRDGAMSAGLTSGPIDSQPPGIRLRVRRNARAPEPR